MRRLVLTMSFLITAASLQAAAGQQTPEPATESAPPPKAPAMRTLTTTAPVQSPLVRAAKASPKRSKKKSTPVITNGDLSKSGGHVTTATKALKPLPVITPDEMTPEQARAVEKRYRELRQAAVAKARKAEADRKVQKERAAAIYNGDDAEGMLEDPALVEGKMTPQPKSDVPPPVKPPAD